MQVLVFTLILFSLNYVWADGCAVKLANVMTSVDSRAMLVEHGEDLRIIGSKGEVRRVFSTNLESKIQEVVVFDEVHSGLFSFHNPTPFFRRFGLGQLMDRLWPSQMMMAVSESQIEVFRMPRTLSAARHVEPMATLNLEHPGKIKTAAVFPFRRAGDHTNAERLFHVAVVVTDRGLSTYRIEKGEVVSVSDFASPISFASVGKIKFGFSLSDPIEGGANPFLAIGIPGRTQADAIATFALMDNGGLRLIERMQFLEAKQIKDIRVAHVRERIGWKESTTTDINRTQNETYDLQFTRQELIGKKPLVLVDIINEVDGAFKRSVIGLAIHRENMEPIYQLDIPLNSSWGITRVNTFEGGKKEPHYFNVITVNTGESSPIETYHVDNGNSLSVSETKALWEHWQQGRAESQTL